MKDRGQKLKNIQERAAMVKIQLFKYLRSSFFVVDIFMLTVDRIEEILLIVSITITVKVKSTFTKIF